MTFKALVMSERADEYTGKRGLVKQQVITVMDQSDTGERLAQPHRIGKGQSLALQR